MGKRSATNRRDQAQKDRAVQRVQELRRSNAAQPERNRLKYDRNDFRKGFQRGRYEED